MTSVESSPRGSKSGLGPLIRRIHFYAGMFIGPFLLIAAITGALYALAPTAENIVYRDVLTTAPSESSVSLEKQIDAAHDLYPDMDIAQVWPASKPGETTRVLLIDEDLDDSRLRSVFVDPSSGATVGDQPSYSGLGELPLRKFISTMHRDLFLGKAGELYVELAASWMWFVALGGAFLWIKRVSFKKSLTGLKSKKKNRAWWTNLHGLAGAWLLIAMLGLSVTGITWSPFAGQNVSKTVEFLSGPHDPINTSLSSSEPEANGQHAHHGKAHGQADTNAQPLSAKEISSQADTVWDTAKAQGLTGSLRLFPPEDQEHAWQASERWVPWRTASDAVSVNGNNGTVIDRLDFQDLPLFSKLTSWGIYLHMGIMFGLPLQLLLFAVGMGIAALVVIGYMLWFKRRPTLGKTAGIPSETNALNTVDWVVIGVFMVTVGLYLPTLGVSLLAMLVADRALTYRQTKSAKPRRAAQEVAVKH